MSSIPSRDRRFVDPTLGKVALLAAAIVLAAFIIVMALSPRAHAPSREAIGFRD